VSSISDSAVIDSLRRQMAIAVAKQVASAGNLANVDTPGYKTKDVNFTETLKHKLAAGNSTFPRAGAPNGGVVLEEAAGLPVRRDGNNVQLDRELIDLSRAAADFSAAQTALAAKFRLIRYAINEGR
jgi:flagellar basal-body rod protein FlgB